VRELTVQILEADGYQVLEAMNDTGALRIAGEYQTTIPLLLTDIVMSGMNGQELAEQLQRRRPNTRVLFMSSYEDPQLDPQDVAGGEIAVLRRPFSTELRRHTVRAVLDQPQ
jgi:two-component system cell cycle sensor histidine kinase/response regulator CckA